MNVQLDVQGNTFAPIYKKAILASTLLSIASMTLLFYRLGRSGSIGYYFLAWNLFLAWIPVFFAALFTRAHLLRQSRWMQFALLAAWLAFLPNSPYILTDLIHLTKRSAFPAWYDGAMIFSFAWAGLMAGFISLWMVQDNISLTFGKMKGWLFAFVAILASAFGVYLGRFLRWNSWDIILHPFNLLSECMERFVRPFHHFETWKITIIFSFVLCVGYLAFRLLSGNLSHNNSNSFGSNKK